MKNYSFIIFMFICCTAFGQGTDIHIKDFHYMVNGDENICENEIKFTAVFANGGGEKLFFEHYDYREGNHYREDITYSFDKIVEKIKVYVYTRERRDGRSCSSGRGSRITQDETIVINMDPCDNNSYNVYRRNGGDFEVEHRLKFTWEATPRLLILQRVGSDVAGYEDDFEATATAGFNTSVYRWQYQITAIGQFPNIYSWRDIPGVARNRNLKVRPESFLPKSDIGKEIHIRTYSCYAANPPSSISYKLRRSAPHIINSETKDVSCYDSRDENGNSDGSLTLTFDRDLEPGDNFNISVVDLSKPLTGNAYDQVRPFSNITFNSSRQVVLDGLPASSSSGFRIDIIGGGYNGVPYFTEGTDHTLTFFINRPPPVAFVGEPNADTNKVNVWCIGGSDGTIRLEARGGVEGYHYLIRNIKDSWKDDWLPFSNQFTHTITGLSKGTYEIKLQDANTCIAKKQVDIGGGEIRLGEEIIKQVIIEEPETSLSATIELVNEPRANGFKDGRILAVIKGGTSYPDQTYDYEWRDGDNNIVTTATEYFNADGNYVALLHSIGKGEYKIIVKDANYSPATDKEGCTITSNTYTLKEPEPLRATIDIHFPISCHIENEYNNGIDFNVPLGIPDQFQDGALIATVTGGVPFEGSIAETGECRANFETYCYRWKKLVNGNWVDLPVNDNVIYHQSVGTYALNVEDKNGIELGTYEEFIDTDGSREYRLIEALDETKYLPQPDKLQISFTNTVVTCLSGNDAEATAIVTGGTPPYTYAWSNGEQTASIKNLTGGIYLVYVTDAKGCRIEDSVKIEQPNGLEIKTIAAISPTCFQGNDGQIQVEIIGGTPPYTAIWNTGSTSASIYNLSSGSYKIEVIDSNGCKTFLEEKLVDPQPILVQMEKERSLCDGQSLVLDIRIEDPGASYSWSGNNGFTGSGSTVEIIEAGQYTATITSSRGCIGTGKIEVKVFDTQIDADFLITTQAYNNQEIILVNVSEPKGETVEWTIPEGVEVVSKSDEKLVLKFEEAGPYDINLRSIQGDCYQDFTKTILVQPAIETPEGFNSQGDFIEEFIIYPNPNGGTFKTKVTLAENANINLKIMNLISGAIMHERSEKDNLDFLLEYSLSLPSGVYLILLETPKGTAMRKVVFE